jgi:hypothetical protein
MHQVPMLHCALLSAIFPPELTPHVASPPGLVASRNWQATAARAIIAPFIFISLIWVVNEALTTGNNLFDPNRSITNPKCVLSRL